MWSGQGLNQASITIELHMRLEEAYEQFRALEKERKKSVAELGRRFSGYRFQTTEEEARFPLNPTRLDKLVADTQREQSRQDTWRGKSPFHWQVDSVD